MHDKAPEHKILQNSLGERELKKDDLYSLICLCISHKLHFPNAVFYLLLWVYFELSTSQERILGLALGNQFNFHQITFRIFPPLIHLGYNSTLAHNRVSGFCATLSNWYSIIVTTLIVKYKNPIRAGQV